MPLATAAYLRHLAARCSRISRDCTDAFTCKELVVISSELVEKAIELETIYAIGPATPEGHETEADLVIALSRGDDGDDGV